MMFLNKVLQGEVELIEDQFIYILNDSPHPQVPLILGLLNTNSEDSLFST